ncbi:S-layer homology domain-containing protein [Scytonema sp. NUACC21]
MNQSYLTNFGKIFLAAAYLAIVSPASSALAASVSKTAEAQTAETSAQQQLIIADDNDGKDDDDDDDDDKEGNGGAKVSAELPEAVKTAVLTDISQRASLEASTLRVVKAERIIWPNGCLGLKEEDNCTKALVPGWQIVIAGEGQMWVYRTNESGAVAKLDEGSTQAITATIMKVRSTNEQISSRTTTIQRRETLVVQRRTQTTAAAAAQSSQYSGASTVSAQSNQISTANIAVRSKAGFTLSILQPSGSFSDVIARVSVKGKRGKGYFKERFLGDYKYKVKHKAKFVKGLKAGDRIIVRLFDTQNRFIGYSEFECLSANTVVNLILSASPTQYKVVRTVYGLDADLDGTIDEDSTTYDYFSEVSGQSVSFFKSSQQVKVSQFQVQSLSAVAKTSVYPASFTQGEFAVLRQSLNVFSSNLAAALKAKPGQLVQVKEVNANGSSTYDVAQMMMDYRELGTASGVRVQFSDVSVNHWAKNFIAELAALEIIEGFPDGTFRPDQYVTRAQFAAMLSQAFDKVTIRSPINFKDVTTAYWAYSAIREAYQMGFLESAGNMFNPTVNLSRLEILFALAQGLNYTVSGSTEAILEAYTDASTIRSDVRNAIAALTQRGVVVNYPDVQSLNADKVATRAEVTALIYKALVSTGEVVDISSQYAVGQSQVQVGQQQREVEDINIDQVEGKKPIKQHCNQGIGNGGEGCDPGNSHPHGGSNDEGGRTPGGKK